MNTLAIISATFHLLALLFLALFWWEKRWWRREAEALQTHAWKTADQLRAMKESIEDAKEELVGWEMKAADLWKDAAIRMNRQQDAEKNR